MKRLLIMAVIGGLCASTRASDLDTTLKQIQGVRCRTAVALGHKGGDWYVSRLVVSSGTRMPISDADIRQIAGVASLEALFIAGDLAVSEEAWGSLAGLANLRIEIRLNVASEETLRRMLRVPKPESLSMRLPTGLALTPPALGFLKYAKLRELDLSLVRLCDEPYAEVEGLEGVEDLNLAACAKLIDAGMIKLRGLRNARSLTLLRIGPTDVEAISNLPRLEALTVHRPPEAPGLLDLSGLRNLKSLTFGLNAQEAKGAVRFPVGLKNLEVGEWIVGDGKLNRGEPLPSAMASVNLALKLLDPAKPQKPENLGWLKSFPNLVGLTLSLDKPGHEEIADIVSLPEMRTLTLIAGCRPFDDEDVKRIAGMRQLTSLAMGGSLHSVTAVGIASLGGMSNLRRLELQSVHSPQVTVAWLDGLWKLKGLDSLHLEMPSEIPDRRAEEALAGIATLSGLLELSIKGKVTDALLTSFVSLKKLRRLDLSGSQGFTDEGFAALVKALPELKEIKWSYAPAAPKPDAKKGD